MWSEKDFYKSIELTRAIAVATLRVHDACSAPSGMVIATATTPRAPIDYVPVLDARSSDRRLHV